MKSKQFCSVCKQWLEMEVVPTGDGEDDDGVVWFRCPRCQGFLPKLKSALEEIDAPDAPGMPAEEVAEEDEDAGAAPEKAPAESAATRDEDGGVGTDDDLPWDSPADMMAEREGREAVLPDADLPTDAGIDLPPVAEPDATDTEESAADEETAEPLAEYAAQLAAADASAAVPYRPWASYEIGQCVHHLAWDDCGVVVGKEDLPGGRQVIKCYFEAAGVVRLIEKAPR